jgi:cysteine desulfurase / selenocysteine lyase
LGSFATTLFDYAWNKLSQIPGLKLHGPKTSGKPQSSIISFSLDGIHPHDLATVLDQHRVQVRAGHHCAMPALAALDLPSTTRISFGVYTELADIDQLIVGINAAQKLLN